MNGIPALAQTVQSQGRGNDTQLVHMTPSEVKGLQAIAMAHGGSLTINPKTGLPEAGFLDSILPMLAGAALTIGTGGAINPAMAGMIVGGGTAAATGDIEKGFMAGFGAYGGAGLGGSLAATGTEAAGASAMQAEAAKQAAAIEAQQQTAANAAQQLTGPNAQVVQAAQTQLTTNPTTNALIQNGLSPEQAAMHTSTLNAPAVISPATPPVPPPTPTPPGFDMNAINQAKLDAIANVGEGGLSRVGAGFKSLGTETGREIFMQNVGGYGGLAKYGGATALPIMASMDSTGAPPTTPQMMRPYTYDAGRTDVAYRTGAPGESTAEQEYFRPRYTPMPIYRAKEGGAVPRFEKGGVPVLEDGGFVLTKKAVDGFGGGDNEKGQEALKKGLGAIPIKGKGTGTSDSIKTSIEGKRPALVSNGEAYVPKKNVKKAGGTTNLYALMRSGERKAKAKSKRSA